MTCFFCVVPVTPPLSPPLHVRAGWLQGYRICGSAGTPVSYRRRDGESLLLVGAVMLASNNRPYLEDLLTRGIIIFHLLFRLGYVYTAAAPSYVFVSHERGCVEVPPEESRQGHRPPPPLQSLASLRSSSNLLGLNVVFSITSCFQGVLPQFANSLLGHFITVNDEPPSRNDKCDKKGTEYFENHPLLPTRR